MPKTIELDGEQVEVFTAAEVEAAKTEIKTTVEAEYAPKLADLTTKITAAETAAAARAGEFTNFRKLSDEQVAALAEKDRIIYQNSLVLKEEQDKRVALEKTTHDNAVTSVIKGKAGTNADLQKKMEEMWPLIQIEALTPEQMEAKAQMVLGAISTTTPNLLAGVIGFTGSYAPPSGDDDGKKGFGETERGKAMAGALGLLTEAPKKS